MAFQLTLGAKIYLMIILVIMVIGLSIYGDTLNSIRGNQGEIKGFFDPGTIYIVKEDKTWLDDSDVVVGCEGPQNDLVYTLSFENLNFYYNGLPGETEIEFIPLLGEGYTLTPPEPLQTINCKLESTEFGCPETSLKFTINSDQIGEKLAFEIVYFRATEGIISKLNELEPSESVTLLNLLNDFADTYLSSTNVFIRDIETFSRGCRQALCASYDDETACDYQSNCYWTAPWFSSSKCLLCPDEDEPCSNVIDENACKTCPGIMDRCSWTDGLINDACEDRI